MGFMPWLSKIHPGANKKLTPGDLVEANHRRQRKPDAPLEFGEALVDEFASGVSSAHRATRNWFINAIPTSICVLSLFLTPGNQH